VAVARADFGRTGHKSSRTLFGAASTIARIRAGEDPAAIAESWRADESEWRLTRAKYLLYQ